MSRNFTNEELSKMLYEALKSQKPIDVISDIDNEVTVEDAYDIQLINVQRALEDGEIVPGKKIGRTSKGIQELLGISEPDYGQLS